MSFLYPLFLIAGATLAIPVLIHLFNLRRYKTVYFPNTRFLKNIQLNSRRQSQVRYKWLLALRLLFLLCLILAFAQPYFNQSKQGTTANRMQVIYIDNSASMSVKKGARTLLDAAKDAAQQQVRNANPGTRFVLLTNDKPESYQPLPADKVLAAISNINTCAHNKTSAMTFGLLHSIMESEAAPAADLYYYSDFQRNGFSVPTDKRLTENIHFYNIPVQAEVKQNLYIDTAYLNSPVLQTGQNNQLIVRSRTTGKIDGEMPVLQLSINGQVKSAASIKPNEKNESVDTLSFQVNDAGWQRILLTVNDASVRFDDTFRITARSAPNLSVLVLNEGQANPYIQAAFRAYNGFRITQMSTSTPPAELKEYNLVILNGITRLDAPLAKTISGALEQGQSICIFPGRTTNTDALNEGLKQLADLRISRLDTAAQAAGSLQQGSPLVKDLFERIPENVQLPVANWHYIIDAGLSANQQSVLSFRNGAPFLASYKPGKGNLYICATAIDQEAGNFQNSYFFVPFLYQMGMQSQGGNVYAITSGTQQPAYLPMDNAGERNMVHLYAPGLDAIPAQHPNGAGLDVFVDQAVQQAGFYTLHAAGADTVQVALNASRSESALETWNINELKSQWKGGNVHWLEPGDAGKANAAPGIGNFPLWKVCAILALAMLAAETYLLAGGFRRQATAAQ